MKTTKRFLSIMIIAVMTICLGAFNVTVSAAESKYSITVVNSNSAVSIKGQTFEVYKIFSADDLNGAFDYKYEAGCLGYSATNTDPLQGTTVADVQAMNGTQLQDFANNMYTTYILNADPKPSPFKTINSAPDETFEIEIGAAGYYLVFGVASNDKGDKDNNRDLVTSLVMCNTASADATVNLKLDAPSLDKKIWHDDNNNGAWDIVGDNQIGDVVKFRLNSKVPDTNTYTKYTYVIHDVLDKCFDLDEDSVKIRKGDSESADELPSKYYKVNDPKDTNDTLTISVDIMEAIKDGEITANSEIYTFYEAELTSNNVKIATSAVDEKNHNDNVAWLEYSNNPYVESSRGKTPDKTVYDWTFAFTVNKVDKDNNRLPGAKFQIKRDKNGSEIIMKFEKIDDFTYVVAPDDAHVDNSNIVDKITSPDSSDSAKKGQFIIKGLNDNVTYTIHEDEAPATYKAGEDVTFMLQPATYNSTQYNPTSGDKLTKLSIDDNDNTLSVSITNIKGNTLVGTGGIGTTIFYIVGGALMAGAVVLLIVRKRINNK